MLFLNHWKEYMVGSSKFKIFVYSRHFFNNESNFGVNQLEKNVFISLKMKASVTTLKNLFGPFLN